MRIVVPGTPDFRDRGYVFVRDGDVKPFAGAGTISIFAMTVGADQRAYIETMMLRLSLFSTIPVGSRVTLGIYSRDIFNQWIPTLILELQNGEGPGMWGPFTCGPFTLDETYDLRSQVEIAGAAFTGEAEASYHGFVYNI